MSGEKPEHGPGPSTVAGRGGGVPGEDGADGRPAGRAGPVTRWGRLVWGEDALQAVRLRRTLTGAVSYLMFMPAIVATAWFGWLRGGWSTVLVLLAAALAVNAAFFLIIRSGVTRGLKDPSLTAVQIATASVLIVFLLVLLRERMDIFLPLYFTSFFFGVFRLDRGQYMRVGALAVLMFVGFFLYRLAEHGYPLAAVELDGLRLLILLTLLVWMSVMGGYVSRLREINARQRAELGRALAHIRELVVRDELTGAYNRRHLWEILERETSRLERRRRGGATSDLAVAILDIDNFKAINDTYGHLVGDAVLREVAVRLGGEIRRQDWVAHPRDTAEGALVRFGGDEFILVLPETGVEGTRSCLERILNRLAGTPVATEAGPVTLTLSIGAAVWTVGESVSDLLARCDRELYAAKAAGRNRLALAGDPIREGSGPGSGPPSPAVP